MSLQVGCPHCAASLEKYGDGWRCAVHGSVSALWRAVHSGYDAFSQHLMWAAGFPTTLPWPLPTGWWVTDFATVHDGERATATMASVAGSTHQDGPVEVLVVCEEAGVGLGARVSGFVHTDPGAHLGEERLRLRVDTRLHSFWPVTGASIHQGASSVVAGEVDGRWMWLVLRPASALLLLGGQFALADVSDQGPSLLELPFGGPAPVW
ncbi:DUF6758 family protein [Nocardioides alcanivorans]|uniref:DUF6758 family protein n=1 Tax=Nocardioides alcanivorans TaxID=2897352 RepID=UPI001F1DE7A5|nr:DUF6758 family protein [Nocardioides alcanivorans]